MVFPFFEPNVRARGNGRERVSCKRAKMGALVREMRMMAISLCVCATKERLKRDALRRVQFRPKFFSFAFAQFVFVLSSVAQQSNAAKEVVS